MEPLQEYANFRGGKCINLIYLKTAKKYAVVDNINYQTRKFKTFAAAKGYFETEVHKAAKTRQLLAKAVV